MEDKLVRLTAEALATNIAQLIRSVNGDDDETAAQHYHMLLSMMHQHDGRQPSIAWNDVQAVVGYNKMTRGSKIEVPATATEGYNLHHHTSDYDGGAIAGVRGQHCHTRPEEGGFAFATWAPTGPRQKPW
jgi:hypothetical protein